MRAISAFVHVVFCVVVANTAAKNFAELAECFHGVLISCGHCKSNIPEAKREPVGKCLKAEAENRRSFLRTCFEENGVVNSQCYKFDSALLPKIYVGSHSKFGSALSDVSKPVFDCWNQCLQEKIGEFTACQEGCSDEAVPENKEKVNQCVAEAKSRYPLPETKSCLATAYGVQQRLRRFKIHQELEIDAEK